MTEFTDDEVKNIEEALASWNKTESENLDD